MEKIQYLNFQNCLRFSNGEVEIVVSTDFGPRILGYNFVGGENVLGIHADAETVTNLGEFKPYGGHRFWIAPENMPNTYAPDNSPVEYEFDENANSIRLVQPLEAVSQTQKEFTVTLDKKGSGVKIHHKLTNLGETEIEAAAWALTIMRGGGEAIIPNETFLPYGAETLLPIRNLTVWSYTDFTDTRWKFGRDFIRLRVDESKPEPQKIGILNKQGYVQYQLEDVLFTKRFGHFENAFYPDLNSNTEIYTAGNFVELETLAPLIRLKTNESTEHTEHWEISKT